MKIHTGIIHGNIIELRENPGLPDGEEVEIQVTTKKVLRSGDGLRRCAGALALGWTNDDDRILSDLARDRLDSINRKLPE